MLIAMIVIPLLFLYFFFCTKKEYDKQHSCWKTIGAVPEEARLTGKATKVMKDRQRFFQSKYIYVLEIHLFDGKKTYKVVKKEPIFQSRTTLTDVEVGETVACLGQWQDHSFLANRIMLTDSKFEQSSEYNNAYTRQHQDE
jgi:hypothetical protein